ncbi:NUDIX hydrolase [uncultured Microscilla sp.]|uniref:NUDIX hydrolase n=1 Tax=uncultured Microscilla sp. TaxID=432653 RepID=UPI002626CFE1|nr:NUDIX hydrolase [uncultured Microscilla sp.]
MDIQPWKKLEEDKVYNGYRSIIKRKFELPNGKVMEYDIVAGGNFASIAALTQDNEVLLVKQFRPGPEQVLMSTPSGYIDFNEDPKDAAKRELLEETGYQAEDIFFKKKVTLPYGIGCQYCFVATGCIEIQGQRLDDTEFIEVITMNLPAFKEKLRNPQDFDFYNLTAAYLLLDHIQPF